MPHPDDTTPGPPPAVTGPALAAERFRLKHNRWPATLAELRPDFLAEVPADPYDGQPLRYRPQADGVVVYSVGPDGQDNGGTTDPANPTRDGADLGFRLFGTAARERHRQANREPGKGQ